MLFQRCLLNQQNLQFSLLQFILIRIEINILAAQQIKYKFTIPSVTPSLQNQFLKFFMLNISFNSDTYSRNLSGRENSILKEYKRLAFGQQSVQYSVNSMHFEDLPQNFPQEIFQGGRKCVRLSGCSFFEMLTYVIWEFLLSNRANQKTEVIKKIRKQIAEKDFMQDSPSTKGLLVKGIKQMHDYVQLARSEKLIAHCMWKTDSMMAFTEFWKCLLAKLSVRNVVVADATKELDIGLFQLLADFLQINFCVYYQSPTEFQKEVYLSQKKKSTLKLDIVVYAGDKQKKDCSKVLDSSVMMDKSAISNSNSWNYIILEDIAEYYRSQLEREDISEIKAVDQSVQDGVYEEKEDLIKLLKLKTRSEINLQKPMSLESQGPQAFFSPHSQLKSAKCDQGLESTRAKKSRRTTDHQTKSQMKKQSMLQIERISMEQTESCLESIMNSMQQGQDLIREMRKFCEKITV